MKLQQKDTEDLELDMSPMIDMVFLLLIFFIVTAQIVDPKPKVTIPQAAAAVLPTDTTGRLMITVTKDEIYHYGTEELKGGLDDLKIKLAENFKEDENMKVLIRADGNVPFKVSEKIMMACAEVGAVDLIFAAFEE